MHQSPNMELKRINRNRIFRFILQQRTTSKSEIAYELRISLPTVTQNLAALMEQNLILETGEYESTGGRRAKMISCNAQARVAVGIDITRNHISAVVVDLVGNIIDNIREPFCCSAPDQVPQKVKQLIDGILFNNEILDESVLGVALSIPAIVASDYRTLDTELVLPFPSDFYQYFQEYIRFPYLFYNDANCGGFAELWRRRPTERDMFYFSLSGTVGGAAMLGNQIYTGQYNYSGEIGHTILVPGGKQCYCGKYGCVDAYCNANVLAELTNGNLADFFTRLQAGDNEANARMETYLNYLSVAIHNVRMLFDCDIILGGYVGSYSALYLDRLKQKVQALDTFDKAPDYLMGCHYNTEASAVGAALMYISAFIDQV